MKGNNLCQITAKEATIHRLRKDQKKKLASGTCSIVSDNNQNRIRLKQTIYAINQLAIGKMQYKHSTSYFFNDQNDQNAIIVVSVNMIKNDNQLIVAFDSKLKNVAQVHDLNSYDSDSSLLASITEIYPEFLTKQVQSQQSKFIKVSKQFGGLMGAVNGLISKPISKVAKTVDSKKQGLYQSQLKDQTKGKWQILKEKASKINQTLSSTLKPVSNSAKNMTSSIGHSFNHSENSVIKAIRDLGMKTKKALNDGYKQGMGQKVQDNHMIMPQTSQSDVQYNNKCKLKQ